MTDIVERLCERGKGQEMFGFDGMLDDGDPLLIEAADEIKRLRAERDEALSEVSLCLTRWNGALTRPYPTPGVMREPAESLYRRTEGLRADALRYRWLRDASGELWPIAARYGFLCAEVDAAIDAAMDRQTKDE